MILTGKPNRPFPPEFQVDIEQFLPGAISAVDVVTTAVASGEWEALEGLVDRECINTLQSNMAVMDEEQKQLVAVKTEDVFLSFVSNPEKCELGNNLNLVTFSMPRLGHMKDMVNKNKEMEAQTEQKIKESIGVAKDKDSMKEALNEFVNEYKASINSNDPYEIFKHNEIVIGNYRLVRSNPDSQWTITEVSQINSLHAWATIFKLRWKGRLGIATRGGYNFYSILRADYISDYIVFSLISGLYIMQLIGAGVITAPHS